MATDYVEKGISDLVGALTDPIIVYPGGWEETLPDWMKPAITKERLVMQIGALHGEKQTATDAEVCAYLYTVSLSMPIYDDWTNIYLYIAGKVLTRQRPKDDSPAFPDDIRVESLTDHQQVLLSELRDWIYKQRVKYRDEKGRAERRTQREQEATRKVAERPALFDF